MMLACLFSKVFIDVLLLWPWQWIIHQPWEKWATGMLPGGEHGASSCWDDASECSQTHPGCTLVRGGKGRLGRLKQKPSGCIPELEKTLKKNMLNSTQLSQKWNLPMALGSLWQIFTSSPKKMLGFLCRGTATLGSNWLLGGIDLSKLWHPRRSCL